MLDDGFDVRPLGRNHIRVLWYIGECGFTQAMVAQITGKRERTVRRWVFEAKARLGVQSISAAVLRADRLGYFEKFEVAIRAMEGIKE